MEAQAIGVLIRFENPVTRAALQTLRETVGSHVIGNVREKSPTMSLRAACSAVKTDVWKIDDRLKVELNTRISETDKVLTAAIVRSCHTLDSRNTEVYSDIVGQVKLYKPVRKTVEDKRVLDPNSLRIVASLVRPEKLDTVIVEQEWQYIHNYAQKILAAYEIDMQGVMSPSSTRQALTRIVSQFGLLSLPDVYPMPRVAPIAYAAEIERTIIPALQTAGFTTQTVYMAEANWALKVAAEGQLQTLEKAAYEALQSTKAPLQSALCWTDLTAVHDAYDEALGQKISRPWLDASASKAIEIIKRNTKR